MQERRAKSKEDKGADKVVATNRRARYDYEILESLECGMVLTGSEVKSLREGHAQIAESYARIDGGELWVFQMHIPPWSFAVGFGSHDPDRKRKLLAHRKELIQWETKANQQQLTIVPLRIYFKEGRAKIELGLAKGRDLPDVPLLLDYVKSEPDRQLLELLMGTMAVARPFMAPPGLSPQRAATLRRAFDKTMQDLAFLAEAQQMGLDVDPSTGEEAQQIVVKMYATPPAVIERAKKLLTP